MSPPDDPEAVRRAEELESRERELLSQLQDARDRARMAEKRAGALEQNYGSLIDRREAESRRPPKPDAPAQVAMAPVPAPKVDHSTAKIIIALIGGVVTIAGSIWAKPTAQPEQIDALRISISALSERLDDLRSDVKESRAEAKRLREWARERTAYDLALAERQGIRIRRPQGSPNPPELRSHVPLRTNDTVGRSPALVVDTPPPEPP